MSDNVSKAQLVLGGAVTGAALYALLQRFTQRPVRKPLNPEVDHGAAHGVVWRSIGGALHASQMYIGDHLKLYETLRTMCANPGSSVTAVELAHATGLSQRWLREWMAQQAATGILILLEGEGDEDSSLRYRLPSAMADVLANPESPEYDISLIQAVPSLVGRAKTMMPEAFRTGIGRTYDDDDVSEAINRHHAGHIRDVVIPVVIPQAAAGVVLKALEKGCQVAELGCGGGNLLVAMAKAFPKSSFHGYEVSTQALALANAQVSSLASSDLSSVGRISLHNANNPGESLGDVPGRFDVIMTFDVIHDAPNPTELIAQAKRALKSDGVWLLADVDCAPSVRSNLATNPGAATMWAFSTCLCMACACSEVGGAGLGTLGFSVPVANKLLKEAGFKSVEVLLEKDNSRWFVVR